MVEDYIVKGNAGSSTLYQTENIRKFNEQIEDNFSKKIETLEMELLKLTDLLIVDGDLITGNN